MSLAFIPQICLGVLPGNVDSAPGLRISRTKFAAGLLAVNLKNENCLHLAIHKSARMAIFLADLAPPDTLCDADGNTLLHFAVEHPILRHYIHRRVALHFPEPVVSWTWTSP